MSFRKKHFFIFATLSAIIVYTNASKCIAETPCSCHLDDETFYDLEKLSGEGPLNLTAQNYTFSFQPCKNIKMDLGSNKTSECNNSTGVSLCGLENGGQPFSFGSTSETKWILGNDTELEFKHTNRSTRIALVCCKSCQSPLFNWNYKDKNGTINLIVSSPHVCKLEKHETRGISTGSVLVILLFVFSGVYLGLGALVLKLRRGARGLELIPNYDFWSEIPGLFRDGVTYTFSGCSTNTYDRI